MEKRGTIEAAYAAIGVSRATLFNWFNRDSPPPGRDNLDRLRKYLGADAAWILDDVEEGGRTSYISEPSSEALEEPRADYGRGMMLNPAHQTPPTQPTEAELRVQFDRVLKGARLVPSGYYYLSKVLSKYQKEFLDDTVD